MDCNELLDILNRGEDSAHSSELHFADELATEATIASFDKDFFRLLYKNYCEEELEKLSISLEQLLTNLKILKNDKLTLAGLLLFGKNPERLRPQFVIKATHFAGNDISAGEFIDKQDLHGKLIEQFKEGKHKIRRSRGAKSDHPFLPRKRPRIQLHGPRQWHSTRDKSMQ